MASAYCDAAIDVSDIYRAQLGQRAGPGAADNLAVSGDSAGDDGEPGYERLSQPDAEGLLQTRGRVQRRRRPPASRASPRPLCR